MQKWKLPGLLNAYTWKPQNITDASFHCLVSHWLVTGPGEAKWTLLLGKGVARAIAREHVGWETVYHTIEILSKQTENKEEDLFYGHGVPQRSQARKCRGGNVWTGKLISDSGCISLASLGVPWPPLHTHCLGLSLLMCFMCCPTPSPGARPQPLHP